MRVPLIRALVAASLAAASITALGQGGNEAAAARLSAGLWANPFSGGGGPALRDADQSRVEVERPEPFRLTPEAQRRLDAFNWKDDPFVECGPTGHPRGHLAAAPTDFSFNGDELTIRHESYDVRTVHMNAAPPPPDAPHSPVGYSVGRWEGDTLVVTTTHISEGIVNLNGIPKSDQMETLERYSVHEDEDGTYLLMELVITDPVMLEEPARRLTRLEFTPQWEMAPSDCEPRNVSSLD